MKIHRQLLHDEHGSMMLELALILPVALLLFFGVINYGLLLQQSTVITDAARAGAEYAQIPGNETNTTQMQSVALASASSIPGIHATATTYCTCPPATGAVSCSGYCSSYGQPAMYAQVTTSATLSLLLAGTTTIPVSSVATVRVSCPTC